MTIKVYFPSGRRYWNDLINANLEDINFVNPTLFEHSYNTKNNNAIQILKEKLKKTIKNNHLLLVPPIINGGHNNYDFLVIRQGISPYKKPYFIYIENYHSLLNYNKNKINTLIKKQIKFHIKSKYFKGFIFFSEFSKKVFINYYSKIIDFSKVYTNVIYPFIKDMNFNKYKVLNSRLESKKRRVNLTYISSLFYLKGGAEILEAYKILKKDKKISLTIITNIDSIKEKDKIFISGEKNISLLEHNLDLEKLKEIYYHTHILLHPTYMDSTACVVLEALKSYIPIIATNTFAIPEYITNNYNGILLDNPLNAYTKDGKVLKYNEILDSRDFINDICENKNFGNIITLLVDSINKIIDNYDFFINNTISFLEEHNEFKEDFILKSWNNSIKNSIYKN